MAGFHIEAEVAGVTVGAAVTRFELAVPSNVSAYSVIKRDAELARRLFGYKNGVRVYADPKSGKIFIEVPRAASERETVETDVMVRSADGKREEGALIFAIGKDVDGEPVYGNLTQLKNVLIGGSCCSGKTTLLHSMIYSFVMKYSPEDVRLILCTDKKTEFAEYKGVPHLLTGQIVTETGEVVGALRWAVNEMERRYLLMEKKIAAGETVRNIGEYNAALGEDEEKLPRIVVMIDGYENYVRWAKGGIEDNVQRLAQKARAAGLHLVIATQDPHTVAGVLRANLPTRIAFYVSQERNSYEILDELGAEKLLRAGDMLMKSEADPHCKRIQGAQVSRAARHAALAVAKAVHTPRFDEQAKRYIKRTGKKFASEASDERTDEPKDEHADEPKDEPKDERTDEPICEFSDKTPNRTSDGFPGPLYIKALAIAIQTGSVSVSLVQRKCGVGYNHAGKIVEWMESMGYITPFDGKKARKVLITEEEFIERFGPLDKAESPVQDDAPAGLRTEEEIKKMIKDAPQKREDLTISLGEYSAFGFGIRVYIDYGKDIAYKRVSSPTEDSYYILSMDIPEFVRRLKEIVSSWEHEMVDERILDGLEYHVTFYKNGEKETEYRGQNKFPENYREFRALLRSLSDDSGT